MCARYKLWIVLPERKTQVHNIDQDESKSQTWNVTTKNQSKQLKGILNQKLPITPSGQIFNLKKNDAHLLRKVG